ncbi:MAG: HAD-IIIA family hydrolase [Thermodesulfobacteriota bacterium]|nr:HAD-IIIA family hydrolase [Thermodesulfobacteriota bacterium]
MKEKDWKKRAQAIRLLLLDVDGVLTDGRIVYDGRGQELKSFDIKDGQGIKLLQQAGLKVGIISGRKSSAVSLRARELGIDLLLQKALDKAKALERIIRKGNIRAEQICFVGDDLVDLAVFPRVGFAVAVADSVKEVKENAHYITHCPGGRGAVREVCELILKVQGKWEAVTQKYFP